MEAVDSGRHVKHRVGHMTLLGRAKQLWSKVGKQGMIVDIRDVRINIYPHVSQVIKRMLVGFAPLLIWRNWRAA